MGSTNLDTADADVTFSSIQSGEVRLNIGEQTTGTGFAAGIACWGNGSGFLARPADPSSAGNAQVWTVTEGPTRRALCLRDQRFAAKGGDLAPGDAKCVTPGEAWQRWDADGKVTIRTATTGGAVELTVTMDPTTTPPTITLSVGPASSVIVSPTFVNVIGVLQVNGVVVVVP